MKTYTLKILHDYENRNLIIKAINEYNGYKTKVGKYIAEKMLDSISTILPYITSKNTAYYNIAEEHKEDLIYNLFSNKYDKNSSNNILNSWLNSLNVEGYENNSLGIALSDYQREGYRNTLYANIRTALLKKEANCKKENITIDSDDETFINQIHYEMNSKNIKSAADMKSLMEYLLQKADKNEAYINRLDILYEFFKNHEEVVMNSYNKKCAERLKDFKGIIVSNTESMSLSNARIKIEVNNGDFIIHLGKLRIPAYGNRQIIKNYIEKYNTNKDISQGIRFKIRNNEIYADVTFKDVENIERNEKNGEIVGVDINTKHTLLVTSIKDNDQLIDYVNIQKEVLKNKNISEEDRNYFSDISQYVTFCPIEIAAIFSRYNKDKKLPFSENNKALDDAITEAIINLKNEYSSNPYIVNYLYNVKKIRAHIKSYFVLDLAYHKARGNFDIQKKNEDDVFDDTETAKELLAKMNNVQTDINGCRDNIIEYAYAVFSKNGYTTLCLEDLQNSNFTRMKYIAKPSSILEYYGCKGKTIDEAKEILKNKRLNFNHYNFSVDGNNKITNVCISEKGRDADNLSYLHNFILKKIRFANIKDKMLQLSNNGKLNVCLIPPEYSSQMNSITHKIYVNEKNKLLPKNMVRFGQEKHRNGLNADFNSASNLRYMYENPIFRETFLIDNKNRNGYSQPYMLPKKKKNLPTTLIKMNCVEQIMTNNAIF